MQETNRAWAHLVAFFTVAIWGTTFVSTKVLLLHGLTPAWIFTLRFAMAYVLMVALMPFIRSKRPMKSVKQTMTGKERWRDELLMAALGIVGGSLYFLAENEALNHTTATNTSLIVCSCPLFAMFFIAAVYRDEKVTRLQMMGSVVALLGMATVVLNGHFVLHLSPLGDLLAFVACLAWAFYSLLMKQALRRYDIFLITRKVFFYGLVTIVPFLLFSGQPLNTQAFDNPVVWGNLLYLGIIASMVCFLTWNWVMRRLGPVVATNWVYFNPITTILFAWWLLNEQITPFFLLGSALILIGMYMADKTKSPSAS
ncbi:MAG: DMT family transporter [Prevotella sp.]|nr:DMT family transporter [Prevotella sp.]